MAHQFAQLAFTPTVRALQTAAGSRDSYAAMDRGVAYNHVLSEREVAFVSARDSCYMASVSETGWPYLQHRGGPSGFIKILDEHTIGFADYSGNRQYVSTGNVATDNRLALFFMDYPNQRRLKLLGRVRIAGLEEKATLSRLEDPDYPAQLERGFVITVEAFDWNCPLHITPRFTEAELARTSRQHTVSQPPAHATSNTTSEALGTGPLQLVVSGIRQLTPRIRAFELRHPAGQRLPAALAGSHLRMPVRLATGELIERHYSIASNPARRDRYEIAVLSETQGRGGSMAVHDTYQLGTLLRVDPPESLFALHHDERPAVLIAGGIGITPIKAMALALAQRGSVFHVHYAGRSHGEMAYSDRLDRQLKEHITLYSSADRQRLDITATLGAAPAHAVVYACGPARLISAIQRAAREQGIAPHRIRLERFS